MLPPSQSGAGAWCEGVSSVPIHRGAVVGQRASGGTWASSLYGLRWKGVYCLYFSQSGASNGSDDFLKSPADWNDSAVLILHTCKHRHTDVFLYVCLFIYAYYIWPLSS